MNGSKLKKEFGDYQTPEYFAKEICLYLKDKLRINPKMIFEPTFGIGNFIQAGIECFTEVNKIYGVEINSEYCENFKKKYKETNISIICDNFFSYDSSKLILDNGEMLVVGNPPWATNSELNFNLPEKVNFKKLSGTDAITGASNFDICEYIILKLIEEFNNTNTTIAMLCKTSVARNILLELERNKNATEYVKILNFNAKKVFGISAAACLFIIKLSKIGVKSEVCKVYNFETPDKVVGKIIFKNGVLSTEQNDVLDLNGNCQLEWRQGVKHDCAGVMELVKIEKDIYQNKRKEQVVLEENLVFPLLKSSSFKKPIINSEFQKYVIVTQKKAREDTFYIENIAPRTWEYLCDNKHLFDARKSSIYKGAPVFSMFGVGDYSYSPYKVGVSGFYKKPLFSLIYNNGNETHPVMLDDTSYFLSFEDYDVAYGCMLLLNTTKVQEFLLSISFQDAKRPYTKKVLQRLDLKKCVENITIEDMFQVETDLKIAHYVTEDKYENMKAYIALLRDVS